MTTPLFLLRALNLGLSVKDLESISIGLILDMSLENAIDSNGYTKKATQEDFDRF